MDVKEAFAKTQLPATLFPSRGGYVCQGHRDARIPPFRPLGWLSTRSPRGLTPSVPIRAEQGRAGASPVAGRLSRLSSGDFPLPTWTNAQSGK